MACNCANPISGYCRWLCRQRAAWISSVRNSVGSGGGGSISREVDLLLNEVFSYAGINFDLMPELISQMQKDGFDRAANRLANSVEALQMIENAIDEDHADFEAILSASGQLIANGFYDAVLGLNQSLVASIDTFESVDNVHALRSRSLSLQAAIYEQTDRPFEALQAHSLANLFGNMSAAE
jgi:hypothetical protein